MNEIDIRLVSLSSIIFLALTSIIIISLDIFNERKQHRQLKLTLIFYFGSHIITQICYIIYFYDPESLVWINWLFILSMVLIPVSLYRFIFKITTTSASEKFSVLHYIAPLFISLVMLILTFTTPLNVQLSTIKGDGTYTGGSYLFFIFSNKLIFRLIFNLTYVVLAFKRLGPYKQYISNYSSNEQKNSFRWVFIILIFLVGLMIIPIYGLFTSRSGLSNSFVSYIQGTIIFFQFSYLVYNVVKRNYVLQESKTTENKKDTLNTNPKEKTKIRTETNTESGQSLKKAILNKEDFTNYILDNKIYKETNLKITDLSEIMGVNRTYMSSFINNELNMNFSNFINSLRYQEYLEMRNNDRHKNKSNAELAELVGFGSYRSFTRFAKTYNN